MFSFKTTTFLLISFLIASCSSVPKASHETVTESEAEQFLKKYCSSFQLHPDSKTALSGEVVVRSSTKEFKGQYPASLHFNSSGQFNFEVTNLLGGTLAILKGDSKTLEIISKVKPKYSRKGIRSYMGLNAALLGQLLHGDLPCPRSAPSKIIGHEIIVHAEDLEWRFQRSDSASGSVPVRVNIFEKGQLMVDLVIESWNQKEGFAEKVKVATQEGDLKWFWRSRVIQSE